MTRRLDHFLTYGLELNWLKAERSGFRRDQERQDWRRSEGAAPELRRRCEIGEGSNIGAGTIFANYDGENKHQTKIGRHVKTGSGNVFVAPVSIGDGAYTAAGSTIRKDVEPGALARNPMPQENLADWVLEKRPGSESAKPQSGRSSHWLLRRPPASSWLLHLEERTKVLLKK